MITENLKQIIQVLCDGEFHSGAELGQKLGMTRAAIWKVMQQLPELEINVESKTNKGYKIIDGLELLSTKSIKNYMGDHHKSFIDQIEIFDSLPSTNDYLLQVAKAQPGKVHACFAEMQTAGKGRLGRQWISPFAKNIYFSLLWHFPHDPYQLSGLSLVIAVAIVEALKLYGVSEDIALKWPNDILWQQKKLGGVLVEICGETNHFCSAVIGVGINVSMPTASGKKIQKPWIDLKKITQTKPQRNRLAGLLLNQMCVALTIFQEQGLKPFTKRWQEFDISKDKKVTLLMRDKKISGLSRGIDKNGCFLLENRDGEIHTFANGEVSLRFT